MHIMVSMISQGILGSFLDVMPYLSFCFCVIAGAKEKTSELNSIVCLFSITGFSLVINFKARSLESGR